MGLLWMIGMLWVVGCCVVDVAYMYFDIGSGRGIFEHFINQNGRGERRFEHTGMEPNMEHFGRI